MIKSTGEGLDQLIASDIGPKTRTLPTMIVNVGIIGVVFDRVLETLERSGGVSLFHVYASNLDK